MSEPDTKLERWCRRLVEAYAEEGAETGVKAKGNGKLAASHQSEKQKNTEIHATGADRAEEAGATGYAGGTEPECAVKERTSPSHELLQLLDSVRDPPATRGGGGRGEAVGAPPPMGEPLAVVPQSLPPAMKTNIYRVTRQQFTELYAVDAALARVETGSISRCELIALYMKSFRNVLNYDLLELREHETYFSRFVGYCTHVLHDLVDALFPDKTHMNIVSFENRCISWQFYKNCYKIAGADIDWRAKSRDSD